MCEIRPKSEGDVLLMQEILHQLRWQFVRLFARFYASQVLVWDF